MGLYKTFETEQRQIFRHMVADYAESLNDSENIQHPTPIRWRKSRNTVKKSSRRGSASRHIHELESRINFEKIFPDKNKALILRFYNFAGEFFAQTNIGEFAIKPLPKGQGWIASWRYKKAIGKSPAQAMARLCGMKWGEFRFESKKSYYASLYDFYREIFFDFPESEKKKPRNNTLKLRGAEGFRMAWEGIAIKDFYIKTPKPEPSNFKPKFTVNLPFEPENSRI